MARNPIQFQKGLSLPEFLENYGTEDQCRAALEEMKWGRGFCCPECGFEKYIKLEKRHLRQCSSCKHQTSVRAGTIFHGSPTPLTKWFLAIYLVTQSKNAISTLELSRQIGVKWDTAWRIRHKLAQVMMERDATKKLEGCLQMDDAYLGGENPGGKRGRGSENKHPFIAVGETDGRNIQRVQYRRVRSFSADEIEVYAKASIAPGSIVISDGLGCFRAVEKAGCIHLVFVTGGGRASVEDPSFKWVNTMLGNLKTAIRGTFHAIRDHHIARYLAEFEYRFNRRADLGAMIERLAYVALRTPPMPYKLLKRAELVG
jgi:ribosomal protein L37AE/L43A